MLWKLRISLMAMLLIRTRQRARYVQYDEAGARLSHLSPLQGCRRLTSSLLLPLFDAFEERYSSWLLNMAEPFGIASGALQTADAGLKLAKTLYNCKRSRPRPYSLVTTYD